jgi:hypothetical protein
MLTNQGSTVYGSVSAKDSHALARAAEIGVGTIIQAELDEVTRITNEYYASLEQAAAA